MGTGKKVRNSDEKLQNKNKAHTQKKLTPRNIRNEKVNQKTSPVHQYTRSNTRGSITEDKHEKIRHSDASEGQERPTSIQYYTQTFSCLFLYPLLAPYLSLK